MHRLTNSSGDSVLLEPFDVDNLKAQQQKLKKTRRMSAMHWCIVAFSLVITVFAWKTSKSSFEAATQLRFEQEAGRVINLMSERINHYQDALLSGVAAMQTHGGTMSRGQWRQYAELLNLTERYPGISGIGVIRYVESVNLDSFLNEIKTEHPGYVIRPEHNYDLYLPITYIEPEATNAAAIGLDVAFETNRRSAALYSRSTGLTQISGPIVLVQDESKTQGFLFYAPFYDDPSNSESEWTDEQREKNFRGLVYAPVIMKDLVAGVLSADNRSVSLSISDADTVMYSEDSDADNGSRSLNKVMSIYGRNWRFDIANKPVSQVGGGLKDSTIVLISGLCLDAMLVALFWLMTRSNRRTLDLAETITNSLAAQAQTLSETNKDLESFAHVVSHDLQTPMRNIHSLAGIIDEDFGGYLASNDEGVEIKRYVDSMQDQAVRGQSLITGILNYSKLGPQAGQNCMVDTRELIQSIGHQLQMKPHQLELDGTFPAIYSNKTLLEQVLTNLVSNAVKYNPDKISATVSVCARLKGGFCRFSVADNGCGIEERFHDRIFQPFTRLATDVDIHSSGIGLSIVKRALDLNGGTIELDSIIGRGSTFTFYWPVVNPVHIQDEKIA